MPVLIHLIFQPSSGSFFFCHPLALSSFVILGLDPRIQKKIYQTDSRNRFENDKEKLFIKVYPRMIYVPLFWGELLFNRKIHCKSRSVIGC